PMHGLDEARPVRAVMEDLTDAPDADLQQSAANGGARPERATMRSKSLNPERVSTHTTDSARSTCPAATRRRSAAMVTPPLGSRHDVLLLTSRSGVSATRLATMMTVEIAGRMGVIS